MQILYARWPRTGSEGIEVAGFRVTDEVLGKGRYSKVVKARHIRTGEEVACKIILKKDGKWPIQPCSSSTPMRR